MSRSWSAVAASVAFILIACAEHTEDTVATDFGDAVAETAQSDSGNVHTRLTGSEQRRVLAEMSVIAASGEVNLTVGAAAVPFDGVAAMDLVDAEQLNLMLYTLWDIDRENPAGTVCTDNRIALCCRAETWRCRANEH